MRLKPDFPDDRLIACLRTQYGLPVVSVCYLPIGYDLNAFVYEARTTAADVSYFVKVRLGTAPPPGLLVPCVLEEHNIPNILTPLLTQAQELWCPCEGYSVVVYPFIRGENAMVAGLTDSQWQEFGATLKAIHSARFAALLTDRVPEETFAIPSAPLVREIADRLNHADFESPAAIQLAAFWTEQAPLIAHLLTRAEALGRQLQSRPFEFVLCHADIHAANILVGEDGRIYLVDWDDPLLAPRERDLFFVAGSRIARRVEPAEEALFFQGYGSAEVNRTLLAYYRYERVIEDIGEFGKSVFLNPDLSEAVREDEAAMLCSQFAPGGMVESALEADRQQGGPRFLVPRATARRRRDPPGPVSP